MSWADRCASLRPTQRRLVAVLLVPTVLMFAWLLIYVPVFSLKEAQTSWRVDARKLLSQAAGAEAVQARLDQDLNNVRASPLWGRFYESARQGSSTTALQADVSSLLGRVSASTQSLAAIPSSAMPHFTRVGLRLSASMRIDQLKSFLAAAQRHRRYLRIEHLTVFAPQTQSPDENPPLAITMEIHGFEISKAPRPAATDAQKLALSGTEQ